MAGMRQIIYESGFTLIELVVVVLIIAVIAGTVTAAFNDDFIDEKEDTAARFEMTQIRDAILAFQRDNPTHALTDTNLCTPADASFLISDQYDSTGDCTADSSFNAWDVNYRLGWQGPYVSRIGNAVADIDTDIQFDGDETTPSSPGTLQTDVPVLTDAYNNPYYFFDLDDTSVARIVSTGPDGDYDSYNNAVISGSECDAEDDDIVLCLR